MSLLRHRSRLFTAFNNAKYLRGMIVACSLFSSMEIPKVYLKYNQGYLEK